MILLSRYTWMWPWVGTMCVVVGFTMCAPCSDTTRCSEVPWITAPFFGETIAIFAGLLGLAVDVGVGVGEPPDPLPFPPHAAAVNPTRHSTAAKALRILVMASSSDGLRVIRGDPRRAL